MYQSVSIQFNSFQPMPVSDVSLAGLRSASVAKIDAMPSQVCDSPHLPLIGFREGRLRNSSSSAALFRPLHLVREPRGSNSFVLRRGTPSATQDQGPGSCQTEDGFAVLCNSSGMRSGSRNISSIKLVALFQGSVEGSRMPRRQICGKWLGDSVPAAELSRRCARALRPLSCHQEFHGVHGHVPQGQRHVGLSPQPVASCRGRGRFRELHRSPFRRSENNATLQLA
jgi:hypothetical protein